MDHVSATWPLWGFVIHSFLSSADWSIKSRLRHSKAWRWSHYWALVASGGAWEGTWRLSALWAWIFLPPQRKQLFWGSLQQIPPEPRTFTSCFHSGQNVSVVKNWLLRGSIGQRAEWPSSGNTGLYHPVDGSLLICTGKCQNPLQSVEILSLKEAELSAWSFIYENPWLLHSFLDGNFILHQLFEMCNSPSSISPFSSTCHFSAFQIKYAFAIKNY